MKNKLCGIGEALIDFIPEVKGQRNKNMHRKMPANRIFSAFFKSDFPLGRLLFLV